MRIVLFTQKVGLAILVGLAVQRTKLRIPTARAAVVHRTGSSPFLIGPPDEVVSAAPNTDDGDDAATADSVTSTITSSVTNTAAKSHTSSGTSKTMSPSASASISTTSSATSDHPDPSPTPLAPAEDIDSKQPSSIRYLVPVFLLILVTLGGWAYSRWYASRKRRDAYAEAEAEKARGEWRQLKDEDADLDEKDPWYAGPSEPVEWQDVDLVPTLPSGAVSVGAGWGWKSTLSAWKSARGKDYAVDAEEIDELGQKRTIKIATVRSQTYHTLPDLEGRPVDPEYMVPVQVAPVEEKGSIRALRDKLASLSYKDMVGLGRLDRNRAPNKRRAGQGDCGIPPPEPPAWISPRAVSPTQILSPPMQPHLFFHPTPSGQSIHGMIGTITPRTASDGSDYGSEGDADSGRHGRFPTIPSNADALASSYTAVPPRTPRRARVSRDSTESVVDGADDTPRPRTSLMRTTTTPNRKQKGKTMPVAPLRRSTALSDLAGKSPTQMTRRATTQERTNSTLSPPTSPRKSRAERKADRAHDKVQDILSASWSDRALASPTSMSIDGMMAPEMVVGSGQMSSPGVESAAVMQGGGGIEQRLAMLKRMDV